MRTRQLLLIAAILAPPLSYAAPAFAEGGVFVSADGENIAVSGYDTVSYFLGDGVPVKGDPDYSVMWNGIKWHFANQANADAFKANPASFAPRYGGHCAWAMSRGSLAPGDPTLYKLVDGKLYLNFNAQVQQTWLRDFAGFIAKADPAWQRIPDSDVFGG